MNEELGPVLPTPEPRVTAETAPFWEAASEGRLLLQRCGQCENFIWYPRTMCPFCHSTSSTWIEASGRGHVFSFSIVRKGSGPYATAGPYVLAYVQLEEGPRLLTNVVDCDPETIWIGQPVEAVFHRASPEAALVRFRPTTD